jgi:hypothetical protein
MKNELRILGLNEKPALKVGNTLVILVDLRISLQAIGHLLRNFSSHLASQFPKR